MQTIVFQQKTLCVIKWVASKTLQTNILILLFEENQVGGSHPIAPPIYTHIYKKRNI